MPTDQDVAAKKPTRFAFWFSKLLLQKQLEPTRELYHLNLTKCPFQTCASSWRVTRLANGEHLRYLSKDTGVTRESLAGFSKLYSLTCRMMKNATTHELFGEIRSCANGASCDLTQLSRWLHAVERDAPGSDAYGYVTHHLGGTPRLWKLLEEQPLDALELLGSLESLAEYRFVQDNLPELSLEFHNL